MWLGVVAGCGLRLSAGTGSWRACSGSGVFNESTGTLDSSCRSWQRRLYESDFESCYPLRSRRRRSNGDSGADRVPLVLRARRASEIQVGGSGQWLPAASGASASSCLWRFCPFPSGSSSGLLRGCASARREKRAGSRCCCWRCCCWLPLLLLNAAEAAPRAVPSRVPSSSSSTESDIDTNRQMYRLIGI